MCRCLFTEPEHHMCRDDFSESHVTCYDAVTSTADYSENVKVHLIKLLIYSAKTKTWSIH